MGNGVIRNDVTGNDVTGSVIRRIGSVVRGVESGVRGGFAAVAAVAPHLSTYHFSFT